MGGSQKLMVGIGRVYMDPYRTGLKRVKGRGFVVLKGEGRMERRKDEKQIFYITRKIERNVFP